MQRDPDEFSVLWDKYLKGGVVLSEYSVFLAQDAELAWDAGAYIAAILAAQSAIETHLRYELGAKRNESFHSLIERADFNAEVRDGIHKLREIRNRWVHVTDPSADEELQRNPDALKEQLSIDSRQAIEIMIRAFCAWQYV